MNYTPKVYQKQTFINCVNSVIFTIAPSRHFYVLAHVSCVAVLTQWVEEMQKLLISRQNELAARMHGHHQNMIQSQQAAMQVAQLAAEHAASQKSSRPYHQRYAWEMGVVLGQSN